MNQNKRNVGSIVFKFHRRIIRFYKNPSYRVNLFYVSLSIKDIIWKSNLVKEVYSEDVQLWEILDTQRFNNLSYLEMKSHRSQWMDIFLGNQPKFFKIITKQLNSTYRRIIKKQNKEVWRFFLMLVTHFWWVFIKLKLWRLFMF